MVASIKSALFERQLYEKGIEHIECDSILGLISPLPRSLMGEDQQSYKANKCSATHYFTQSWVHERNSKELEQKRRDNMAGKTVRSCTEIISKTGVPTNWRAFLHCRKCKNNNTQNAAVAPRPSTTHPLVWAEQHKHTSVYNLPVPGLPP